MLCSLAFHTLSTDLDSTTVNSDALTSNDLLPNPATDLLAKSASGSSAASEISHQGSWPLLLAEFSSHKILPRPALRVQGLLNYKPVLILIDCGAELECVDNSFLAQHRIRFVPPEEIKLDLQLADGSPKNCGLLATAHLSTNTDQVTRDLVVTDLAGEDVILGMPWLQSLNPFINWRERTLLFQHNRHSHLIPTLLHSSGHVPIISTAQAVEDVLNGAPAWLAVVSPTDPSSTSNPPDLVHPILAEFSDVTAEPSYPPARPVDHVINLLPGAPPQMGPMFRLAPSELKN